MGLLTVQITAEHHPTPASHGALWTLVVMLLGLGLVALGVRSGFRDRQWRAQAASALGRIVDHVSNPGRRRAPAPVIEFAAGSRVVTFCVRSRRTDGYWPVGQEVGILYDPTNPQHATLAEANSQSFWLMVAGGAVLGLFLVAIVS